MGIVYEADYNGSLRLMRSWQLSLHAFYVSIVALPSRLGLASMIGT